MLHESRGIGLWVKRNHSSEFAANISQIMFLHISSCFLTHIQRFWASIAANSIKNRSGSNGIGPRDQKSEWGVCPHGLATPCMCGMGLGRGRKFFRRRRRRPPRGKKKIWSYPKSQGEQKPSKINPRRLQMGKVSSFKKCNVHRKEKQKEKKKR